MKAMSLPKLLVADGRQSIDAARQRVALALCLNSLLKT